MADEFGLEQPAPSTEFLAPEPDEPEKGFPSVRYGPDGQSAVFQSKAEVPEGWHDHPSKVPGAPDPSQVGPAEKRPGKAEIMKGLKRLDVTFSPLEAGSALYAKLLEAQAGDQAPSETPAKPPRSATKPRKAPRRRKARKAAPAKPQKVADNGG